MTEEEEDQLRQKISKEIMALDLSEAKAISSDWFAASMRIRMVCSIIALGGKGVKP